MIRYDKYNPYFREQLLYSIIGSKLIKIEEFIYTNHDTNSIINHELGIYSFTFDDINLNICAFFPNKIILYEDCYDLNSPIKEFSDILQKKSGQIFYTKIEQNILTKREIKNEIEKCIGQKISSISLLSEGKNFGFDNRKKRRIISGSRGIILKFMNGESLYVYLSIDIPDKILTIETNCSSLDQGVLKTDNFFSKNIKNTNNLPFYIYPINVQKKLLKLKNLIIDRKKIIEGYEINISNKSKVTPNKIEFITKEIRELDLNKQIDILTELKEILINEEFGLIDLKFGFDENLNIKIIKPIDVIPPLKENIIFIDSIINVFSNNI